MSTRTFEEFIRPKTGLQPRVMIIAAHPDDETISAGGRLAILNDVCILHVTDGAPRNMLDAIAAGFETRDAYARARRGELAEALALAGKDMTCTRQLGLMDQGKAVNRDYIHIVQDPLVFHVGDEIRIYGGDAPQHPG